MKKSFILIGITLSVIAFGYFLFVNKGLLSGDAASNGKTGDNRTAAFFGGIEIQYETEEQREVIIKALKDMLTLNEEELRKETYPDYFRNGQTIKLGQVIHNYFVPDDSKKALGEYFYQELQTEAVRELLWKLLDELQRLNGIG